MKARALGVALILSVAFPSFAQDLFGLRARRNRAASNQEVESDKPLFPLTKDNGPVMVKVASFLGEYRDKNGNPAGEGLAAANALAKELRDKHGIDAYVYRFQIADQGPAMTPEQIQEYKARYQMAPRLPRLQNAPPVNWVVLAGDFDSFEDSGAKKMLNKVRAIDPDSVDDELLAMTRMHTKEGTTRNGFTQAMLVFNPHPEAKTPVQNEDESAVQRMLLELNDPKDGLSIYNQRSPFTMAVYQFRGINVLDEEKADSIFNSGLFRKKEANTGLQTAARNAIILAEQMRRMGYNDAYVFHGQFASLVCVGGYSSMSDARARQDFEKFTRMQVGELQLQPQLVSTPRQPTL